MKLIKLPWMRDAGEHSDQNVCTYFAGGGGAGNKADKVILFVLNYLERIIAVATTTAVSALSVCVPRDTNSIPFL